MTGGSRSSRAAPAVLNRLFPPHAPGWPRHGRRRVPAPPPRACAAQGSLARGGGGRQWRGFCVPLSPPVSPPPRRRAMAAPPASPGPRSRFEQEQERAVRALVRCVTSLPEEELGGERFQAALSFAWSNFRSAGAGKGPGACRGLWDGAGPAVRPDWGSAGLRVRVSAAGSMSATPTRLDLGLLGIFSSARRCLSACSFSRPKLRCREIHYGCV